MKTLWSTLVTSAFQLATCGTKIIFDINYTISLKSISKWGNETKFKLHLKSYVSKKHSKECSKLAARFWCSSLSLPLQIWKVKTFIQIVISSNLVLLLMIGELLFFFWQNELFKVKEVSKNVMFEEYIEVYLLQIALQLAIYIIKSQFGVELYLPWKCSYE